MLLLLFSVVFISHISGQTLVGIPTEVYMNGSQYVVFVIAAVVVRFFLVSSGMSFYGINFYFFFDSQSSWALAYVSLPQFHRIGLTSTFEYLERRFDRRIRLLGSFIYILKYISFIPVVIYIPSLAFSQGLA